MNTWGRRLRGALGTGVTWAIGWAIAGVCIGVSSIVLPGLPWDAFFEVFDAPLPAFAVPGFFAGLFFSLVLGLVERGRSVAALRLTRIAAWGALGGLLLTALPFALVAIGLASRSGSSVSTWQILAVLTAPFVLLSAASAMVSVMIARRSRGALGTGSSTTLDVRRPEHDRALSPPAPHQVIASALQRDGEIVE